MCIYSLSVFKPTRFSSSNMASNSSVRLASILPISFSTFTETFWPLDVETGILVAIAPPVFNMALASIGLPAIFSSVLVEEEVSNPANEGVLSACTGGYCNVGDLRRERPTLLPPLAVLPMLSLRIKDASCNEDDDFSEWNECVILAMVLVEDDDDDDEEECKWLPGVFCETELLAFDNSWRLSKRCFIVPVFSFANGIVSIESMLEFD